MNLSGCFWSHDVLHGQKNIPIKTNSKFENMLRKEIKKLDAGDIRKAEKRKD